jgi:hypothetical protein
MTPILLCNQIDKNEKSEACDSYGERRVAYRVLVRKPEGKRPLGKSRRKWQHNIDVDF